MPGAVADLAALGVDPPGHRLAGIRYLGGGRTADAPFRHGDGRGVRRTTLHRSLTDAVADAGVKIVRARGRRGREPPRPRPRRRRARRLPRRGGRPALAGAPDARPRPAARGAPPVRAPRARRDGAVDAVRRGALGRGVGGLRDPGRRRAGRDRDADRAAGAVRPAARRARRCSRSGSSRRPLSRTRGAGPLRQRSTARTLGRVLLVGDAAGYVDALTGEGIALGLAQARAAVEAVVLGRPADYEAAYKKLGRRHELLTHALLSSSRRPAGPPPDRAAGGPAAAGLRGRRRPAGEAGMTAEEVVLLDDDGRRHRHRAQGRGARHRHPAAPRVLLLRLRRGRAAARHPAGRGQADLRRRLDQQLLRPPGAGRADRRGGTPPHGPGARPRARPA